MARRILVTGGTGFVGRHVLPALDAALPDGDEIVATGHEAGAAPAASRASLRRLDVLDRGEVERLVGEVRPTHTLHLAALASVHQALEAPAAAWRVNLCGSVNLAEALARRAPGGTLVLVSTAEVYGRSFAAGEPLDEGAPLAPANPYAKAKAAAESAVQDVAGTRLRVVVLRPFNHTGPGQDERFVVPAFAAQIARIECGLGEPVLRVGNLSAERDFLDVRDVARAYVEVLRRAEELPMRLVLNVASGVPRRIEDVLGRLKALARRDFAVEPDRTRLRPSDTPRAVGSRAAIEAVLGWRPEIPWEDTLAAVLDDWRLRAPSGAAPREA